VLVACDGRDYAAPAPVLIAESRCIAFCLIPAVPRRRHAVTTIEALPDAAGTQSDQQALLPDAQGFQCCFCTAGNDPDLRFT